MIPVLCQVLYSIGFAVLSLKKRVFGPEEIDFTGVGLAFLIGLVSFKYPPDPGIIFW